ncbi:potassium channel family protein [Haladaptatus halobius]|uniref:potassium channel family protein n=1 Tax=Haladaptatus halobius TaxID=2884875 RepID=UPI001D0ADC24|nr:TrkA family potassium uptake protein [Haladaptatus halobius]
MSNDALQIVLLGGGHVGYYTAEQLVKQGHNLTIIERDQTRCDLLLEAGFDTVLHGEAVDPDVLGRADLACADVVAGLTDDIGSNLAVCLVASKMEGVRTVLRVDSPSARDEYEKFVDQVIFPEGLGALATVSAITGGSLPDAVNELTGIIELLQIQVTEDAPVAGTAIRDIAVPDGCSIVVDMDEKTVVSPATTLRPGMNLLVATEPAASREIVEILTGNQ